MRGGQYDNIIDYHYHFIVLYMHEIIKVIISKIGKEPLCNGKAERAPHIFGKCFILCWRCTSLIVSILLCCCICYGFNGNIHIALEAHDVGYIVILILPTFIDGILQYVFYMESTNSRRVLLGVISGIGLWMLASWANSVLLPVIKEMSLWQYIYTMIINSPVIMNA